MILGSGGDTDRVRGFGSCRRGLCEGGSISEGSLFLVGPTGGLCRVRFLAGSFPVGLEVKTGGINSVRLSVYQPLEQIGNRKPANTREEFTRIQS